MRIRKKIMLLLCLCFVLASLVACGQDPTKADYNGKSYEELEGLAGQTFLSIQSWDVDAISQMVQEVEAMPEAERLAFLGQAEGVEQTYALMKSWAEIAPELGAFQDIASFEVEKSGKTTTTELVLNFEKRQAVLTHVYNSRTMENSDITIDLVYSTGEKMGKAAMNTVMGMCTVFVMLIIIYLIISCFGVIPKIEKSTKEKKNAEKSGTGDTDDKKEEPLAGQWLSGETQGENLVSDLELVAVIAAAVSAYTGESTEDFVVRSIKRR